MNDLTPSFERETGQVILEGLPAGVAGEASLIPVPGLDLAFDRADGRLCRAVVDTAGTDGSIAVGEQVAAMLIQLFGAQAPSVVSDTSGRRTCSRPSPGSPERCPAWPASTRPGPPARFRPARPGGRPRPPNSPNAPACTRGPAPKRTAPWPSCSGNWTASTPQCFPKPAARAALAVAALTAADEPAAATRLREAIGGRSGPPPAAPPPIPEFDVAAEVESLEKDRVRLVGLQWMLDPDLVPEGLFRPGLSPYSDLSVRHDGAKGQVVVEAVLAPGADCGALSRCLARLVDPAVRRVLAQAAFSEGRAGPRPGRAAAPVPAGRTTGELDRGGAGQAVAGPQRQGTPDQARPALGRRGPSCRTRPGRTGPALGSRRLGRPGRRGLGAVPPRLGSGRRRRPADLAARRQAVVDPRSRTRSPMDGPAYLAEVLGR